MNDINPIALFIGASLGGVMGFFCGKIPYNAAMKRHRESMAMAGMVLSVVFGMMGGCLLALPFALIFTAVISGMGEGSSHAWDDPGYRGGDRRRVTRSPTDTPPPLRPYTEIGHLVVCGACQMATSKADGLPPQCPHCAHQFAATIPRPKKRSVHDDDGIVPLQVAEQKRRRT